MSIIEEFRKERRTELVGELFVLAVSIVCVASVTTCFYTLVQTILQVGG